MNERGCESPDGKCAQFAADDPGVLPSGRRNATTLWIFDTAFLSDTEPPLPTTNTSVSYCEERRGALLLASDEPLSFSKAS